MFVFVWCEKWARIPYDLYPVSNPCWYSDHFPGRTPCAHCQHTQTHTHTPTYTHTFTYSFTQPLPDQLTIVCYTSDLKLLRLAKSVSSELC